MSSQRFSGAKREGAPSSIQISSVENKHPKEDLPEDKDRPSNLKNLVRKVTDKVKPSKGKEASKPTEQESPEDRLADFRSRNPGLFPPGREVSTQARLEIPEPVLRERTLTRSQRRAERLEHENLAHPPSVKELEEQKKAKETMRQSKNARFRSRLEDYL